MWLPDRRTLIVLGALVGAMTLSSGLLLVLEPSPVALSRPLALVAMDPATFGPRSQPDLTAPTQDRRWQSIIIRESGTLTGSADQLHRDHQARGLGGLAYHFVVGTDGTPAATEAGFRWTNQLDGAFGTGPDAQWFNQHAIGVCLIGDSRRRPPSEPQLDQLIQLVRLLQVEHGIPADRVVYQGPPDETGTPGRLFPLARFRQQLLRSATP